MTSAAELLRRPKDRADRYRLRGAEGGKIDVLARISLVDREPGRWDMETWKVLLPIIARHLSESSGLCDSCCKEVNFLQFSKKNRQLIR
jgi:hypothetical protein